MKHWLPILICMLLMTASCKTVRYIEKEVPVIETRVEYQNKNVHDSIYVKDSVYLYINGDTVIKSKETLRTLYLLVHDTIVQKDSIPYVIKTTLKEILYTNRLYWWQKMFIGLGILLCGIGIWKLKNLIKKWTLM